MGIAPIVLLASFAILGLYTFIGIVALFSYFYATARDETIYDYHISSERQQEAIERFIEEVKAKNVTRKE